MSADVSREWIGGRGWDGGADAWREWSGGRDWDVSRGLPDLDQEPPDMDWRLRPPRECGSLGKMLTMKKFPPALRLMALRRVSPRLTAQLATLVLTMIGQAAFAQFSGKLVYQLDRHNTRLVMTYIQSGTNARVTAYDITLKNGVPDSSTISPQDTILFDLAGATETHLQHHTGRAFKTKYTGALYAAMMPNGIKGASQTALRAPDSGQVVNGYHIAHYQLIEKSPMGTGTRDIWITHDLGPAPTIWVLGSYLYYTPGFPSFTKLMNAGANGIVVQTQSSFTHQGLQYTMTLISVDKRRVAPHTFDVPSRYTQIDNSNMPIPKVGQ